MTMSRRLHDMELWSGSRLENTDLTGAVWSALRAAGIRPSNVYETAATAGTARVDIALEEQPTTDQQRDAELLLRALGIPEPRLATTDSGGLQLGVTQGAPDDEFEILGVGLREDSYTALLAHALRHVSTFRQVFLTHLALDSAPDDWRWRERPPIPFVPATNGRSSKRTKGIPDLVGYSANAGALVVVENKVLATEGDGQLAAYADSGFLDRLARHLKLSRRETRLVFLTPDGLPPTRGESLLQFVPMSYADLLPMLGSQQEGALGRAVDALRRRLTERRDWPAPRAESVVYEYLAQAGGLVTTRFVFERVCAAITPTGFTSHPVAQSSNASGPVFYKQFVGAGWERRQAPDRQGCTIHFELQWAPQIPELRLHLHQETLPYIRYKELTKGHAFHPLFLAEKAVVKRALRSRRAQLEPGWKLDGGRWSHASARFDEHVTIGSLRERLAALTATMSAAIGEVIPGLHEVAEG